MNNPASNLGKTIPMRAESVNFTDGMIVTADDLSTAMAYPLALMKSVNRAVFGCGVVCGFKLSPDPDLCDKTKPCDPCDPNSEPAYPGFTVEIGQGTALDCSGLPVELCTPVRFDLGSKECGCDVTEGEVCIFIRRVNSREAPRGDCCGSTDGRVQCSRLQDHVEIRAFPKGPEPEHACMLPFDTPIGNEYGCGSAGGATQSDRRWPEPAEICECLTNCRDSDCCGEGWILLGCLELCEAGIVKQSFESACKNRMWIKTIECACRKVEDQSGAGTDVVDEEAQNQIYRQIQSGEPNPEFENQLIDMFGDERRVNTLLATGAGNLTQLKVLLELRQPQLQKAFDLKTDQVLTEYLKTVDEQIKKERYG